MRTTIEVPKPPTTTCTQKDDGKKCKRRSVVMVAKTKERYCAAHWAESPENPGSKAAQRRSRKIKKVSSETASKKKRKVVKR